MTDIEISKSIKLHNIKDIAESLGLNEEDIEEYGKYKAKITNKVLEKLKDKKKGKLVLVTSINPTPLGEGKTTMSIAIADGLKKIGKNAILALREPSLGPVFGIKGGATGGGMVQIAPMEDINLHFTGDIHAITAANNLLASLIDNHIYFGNELGFKKVTWKRCLDLNDRQLRKVNTGLSEEGKMVSRMDSFDISVASEVMAILCLATDLQDLKLRLGNILVGYNHNDEAIYAKDLKAEGSMAALLKDAIKPNLVQTLEHTPAIVHGGPFANIAHGCNSIIATKMALKLSDYVITEAGFGADLGAEKFLDIKCRIGNLKPDAVVIVATMKALKYHGGVSISDVEKENVEGLEKGLKNLLHHINHLKNNYGLNVMVAINKYGFDTQNEIDFLSKKLEEQSVLLSLVEGYTLGGLGAMDIANKLVNLSEVESEFKYIYNLDDSIEEKIRKVATNIYGAKDVTYEEEALKEIKIIERLGYDKFPICIAKTQYSLSDDPKNLECNNEYNITVRNIELKTGAGFIVVLTGNVMTMPGLSRNPSAEKIDIDDNGNIIGIF